MPAGWHRSTMASGKGGGTEPRGHRRGRVCAWKWPSGSTSGSPPRPSWPTRPSCALPVLALAPVGARPKLGPLLPKAGGTRTQGTRVGVPTGSSPTVPPLARVHQAAPEALGTRRRSLAPISARPQTLASPVGSDRGVSGTLGRGGCHQPRARLPPAQPPVRAQNSCRCLFLVAWHLQRYLCSCLLLQLISSFTNSYIYIYLFFFPPCSEARPIFSSW